MSQAPMSTLLEGLANRRARAGGAGVAQKTRLSFDGVAAIEIVAPDGYSAALLQGFAAPWFRGEIVDAPGCIVRFHPPAASDNWAEELLALVERWLKSVPLPSARVVQGDCRYLIRTSFAGR